MADTKKEINKEDVKELIMALNSEGMLEELLSEMKAKGEAEETEAESRPSSRVKVRTLNAARRKSKNNPMLGLEDNRFYAVAAYNGYALYRDRDKCEGQVVSNNPARKPYLHDAYVESFFTAKEAMEWIKAALAEYFGITGIKLKDIAYMLKWETYWFTKGSKMPWEQRQQNYNYNNDY